MNTIHSPLSCTVQSITDAVGRRTLKFISTSSDQEPEHRLVAACQPPFRLKLLMAQETQFSFEPVIQVRSHAKS